MAFWWRALFTTAILCSIWLPATRAASPKNKKDEDSYTIGGVLSGYESEKHFQETIEVSESNPIQRAVEAFG